MVKKFIFVAVAVLLMTGPALAGTMNDGVDSDLVRINVGLKSRAARAEVFDLLKKSGGKFISEIPQIKVLTFTVPRSVFDIIQFDGRLARLVTYIEEDHVRQIPPLQKVEIAGQASGGILLYPNDPQYPNQWGPPCIDAEQAWDIVQGNPEVIVAIVDTGIDLDHPDLAANIDTGIDYDFVQNDYVAEDDQGHGTHCAGVVAAEINNMVGIAGLQQVTLMAVKSLNWLGVGFDSWLSNGIIYAAANGARVISCSWGGYGYSTTIKSAVDYAYSQGALVVAAAGNDGVSTPHYPSAYKTALGVSALGTCEELAWFSNWGFSNVLIAAPGEDILSTYLDGGYAVMSGTSMATPHVAGVAAAYFSYNPSLTLMQVVKHMRDNADDLGTPGRDELFGYGRVDMYPFGD
jgi:subtilisin family serine protease